MRPQLYAELGFESRYRRAALLLALVLLASVARAAGEVPRVLSLAPSLTELVCALDACGWLVAVDLASNWPPEIRHLPRLGDLYRPDLERIITLRPDLVLSTPFGVAAQRLRALGVRVEVLDTDSYDDLFTTLVRLGDVLHRPEKAASLLHSLRAQVAAQQARVEGLHSPTIYYEIDPTPFTAGGRSYVSTLIELAGGRNIAAELQASYSRISPEFVLRADPEVIVLADAPHGVGAQALAARPGWAGLRALRGGHVCELNQQAIDVLHRPGPRVAEALAVLASCLHSDLTTERK